MKKMMRRVLALALTLVMVIGLMPNITLPATAAEQADLTVTGKVADPSSFDNWEDYYGDNALLPDGGRGTSTWKAGGVWTDKSVYPNTNGLPSAITMDNQENNFPVALSALASNKEIVGQASTPTDTMLVLDLSNSMDTSGSVDEMIEAANETIDTLLKMNVNNRVGVVLYSGNTDTSDPGYTSSATVILPLDRYTTTTSTTDWERVDGQWTQVTKYQYLSVSGSSDTTVSVAEGTRNALGKVTGSKNTNGGTYIQNGLFKAWQEFEDMTDKGVVQTGAQAGTQRQPILILMSDGRPTLATEDYNNVGTSESAYGNGSNNSTSWETVFLTQLTAAWVKGAVKDHYNNTAAKFYTLGLGTGNDTYATGVLNPGGTTNNDVQTWWNNFITGEERSNGTVRVQNSSWGQSAWDIPYDDDRFATGVGKNYVNQYWSANDVAGMIAAFKEIVAEIGLQSAYSATLVESGDADLDGYITVQDELGSMMQVKDVKGIVLGSTLYSGVDFASGMAGLAGTENGDELVRSLKERLGITDTSVIQGLIDAAYNDGQLNYTSNSNYSNYIGWYGDSNNGYLGFWDKDTGLTAEGAPNGAKYINRSYLYLGSTDHGGAESDMMHIIVLVRTEIATGHQTVLFRVPSALIPMVEYKVELEGDSLETATDITLTVEETDPIRLVYEVGLPDDVNNINIEQKVAEHMAKGGNHIHKDANGNYIFYANSWGADENDEAPVISNLTDAEKLAITAYLPESHFIPNTANERFYVQEDSVVYTRSGNTYTPVTSGINANGTYYFARTIVTVVNGTARAVTQYEQLQSATVANASNFQRNSAGQWEVKAGTVRQQLSNVILQKDENRTDTIANTDQLWVNVTSSDPSDYNIYSFLGNNGKFTVAPATGIKVTKDVTELAVGASANEEFEIQVLLDWDYSNNNVAALAVTDAEGNLLESTEYAISASLGDILVTLNLADGESAYITGMPADTDYTVTEADHEDYTYTYAGAAETKAGTIVEGVVTNTPKGFGDLTIVKDIYGVPENMSDSMAAAMAAKVFTFEVDLGAENANAKFAVDATNAPPENVLVDGKLVANAQGVITVKLKDNESITILDIPEGTAYTVTETDIPDGYIVTLLSNGAQSGAIVKNENKQAHFVNAYNPAPAQVSVDFTIQKMVEGSTYTDTEDFIFQVQMLNAEGNYVNVGDQIVVANGGTMTTAFTRSREFTNIGTYHFRIVEVEGNTTGMTYSSMRALFAVVVTDENADGVLEAKVISEGNSTVSDNDVTATFTNTYEVGSTYVEIDMYKDLENETGIEISKTNFQFGLYKQGETTPVYTITSGEQGYAEIRIPVIDVNQNGETYILKEIVPADSDKIPGMTYSTKEYTIVLNVTDRGGQLEATYTVDGTAETTNADEDVEATFKNEYVLESTSYDLTAKKVLNDKTPGDHKFTFVLHQTGSSFAHDVTTIKETQYNAADGSVAFSKLTFPKAGNYYYAIVEQAGTNPGMTYDTTHYHVTITVGIDPEDATKLKVTNVAVNKIGANSDTSGEIVFVNTYAIIKPEEVVIEGLKTLKVNSGLKALNAGDYTFGLYNEAGEKVSETTNLANGTFKFDAIEYTGVDIGKTYTYTVKEVAPDDTTDGSYSANGVDYSGASFTVTVKVIDNGDGTMRTEVTGNGADNIEFVNEYRSNPVSVSLPGTKDLDGRDLVAGEFKYAIYESDATFESRDLISDQITHDVGGDITFSFGTLGMGYHYYVVKEVIPETRAPGIHYDASEYYITIQVTDSGNGQMSYLTTVKHSGDPNAVNPAIAFNNIYEPEPGELILSGSKTYLGGKTLEDDVFSVGMYEGTTLLQTADVKADKTFTFQALEYTADDVGEVYTYTVKEIIPDGAADNGNGTFTSGNNIYDGTIYTVVVTITDTDKDGALEITKTVNGAADTAISFTNTFVPDPIQHTLQAKKTYEKGLKGGDFEFKLVSADGKTDVDQTKENAANGDIVFDPITFSAAGEYQFKLTEKKDGIFSFIRPSEAEYEITVTVVNENGVLRVSNVASVNTKNTNESALEFINTYVMDGEDEITLRGTKTLTGDRTTVNEGEFEFGLYDAAGELVEKVSVKADGTFAFKTLKFDETDVPVGGSKQITYTVKEIAGTDPLVTYDDTVYTVAVTVEDDDQGGVKASYTINGKTDGALAFTNTFTAPENVTANIYIQKNVVNKTQPGIGLDGFQFVLELDGDVFTDTSDAEGKAGFQITFGYQDVGKTYTFKAYEKKGSTAGVTYDKTVYDIVVKVEQNPDGSLKTIINDVDTNATQLEFTNTYEKPETPVTGDNFPIIALGSLLAISGAAIVVLMLTKKKKGGKYAA